MSNKIGSNRSSRAARAAKPESRKAPSKPVASKPAAPSSTFEAQKPSQVQLNPQPAVVASALRFDAGNPEVQAFAQSKGWSRPGLKTTVFQADLVYTTDGWKTTHTAPIQYLQSGYQGFVLRDVAEGTPIEYAVHVHAGVSHDNFYSLDEKADFWANNGGQNYRGVAGSVLQ